MGICLNCRVRTKEITIEVILFEYSRTRSTSYTSCHVFLARPARPMTDYRTPDECVRGEQMDRAAKRPARRVSQIWYLEPKWLRCSSATNWSDNMLLYIPSSRSTAAPDRAGSELGAYVKHCAPQTHMVVSPKRIWRGAGRQEMQIFCWIRIHNILFANRKWAVRSS